MPTMVDLLAAKYGKDMAEALDIMREAVWAADGFVPTPMQAKYIFDGVNLKLVAGGVRAGKSKSTARSMDWFATLPGSLIWIIGPDYHQCTPNLTTCSCHTRSLALRLPSPGRKRGQEPSQSRVGPRFRPNHPMTYASWPHLPPTQSWQLRRDSSSTA